MEYFNYQFETHSILKDSDHIVLAELYTAKGLNHFLGLWVDNLAFVVLVAFLLFLGVFLSIRVVEVL